MDFTGKIIDFHGGPEIVPSGVLWVLTKKYVVTIGASIRLVCPSGMETDGASIPRFFWRVIGHPMSLPYVKAAVLHDAGYMARLRWYRKNTDGWVEDDYTREEIDNLFLEIMKMLGVSWWRRRLMYIAVRWFGGGNWTET